MGCTATILFAALSLVILSPLAALAAPEPSTAKPPAAQAPAPLLTSSSTASQDDITGGNYTDCANPIVANLTYQLVLDADVVITGLVASAGNGTGRCTNGTDLVADYANSNEGTVAILVVVQCVHKGAVACRSNSADTDSGACVVLVTAPGGKAAGAGCDISQGGKYMFLLSAKPPGGAPTCGRGWYSTMHPHIRDTVRSPLGLSAAGCFPYPTWPDPDTGFAAAVSAPSGSTSCPGAIGPSECSGANDTCAAPGVLCGDGSAIGCVTKTCPGKLMFGGSQVHANATCGPVYYDRASGLPKKTCLGVARRVKAQQKRLRKQTQPGGAVTRANADDTSKPTLKSLDQLLNGTTDLNFDVLPKLFNSALAQQQAAKQDGNASAPAVLSQTAAPSP